MTHTLTVVLGGGILTGVALWVAAGLILRLTGTMLTLTGAALLTTGHAVGVLLVIAGPVLWLAGQLLYGLRHRDYRSPLARRVMNQTPLRRLDSTRNWAITTNPEPRPPRPARPPT